METRFETLEEELIAIDCMAAESLVKYYGTNNRHKIEKGVVNFWRTQMKMSESEIKEALSAVKESIEEEYM
jgi:hypothetical protein